MCHPQVNTLLQKSLPLTPATPGDHQQSSPVTATEANLCSTMAEPSNVSIHDMIAALLSTCVHKCVFAYVPINSLPTNDAYMHHELPYAHINLYGGFNIRC